MLRASRGLVSDLQCGFFSSLSCLSPVLFLSLRLVTNDLYGDVSIDPPLLCLGVFFVRGELLRCPLHTGCWILYGFVGCFRSVCVVNQLASALRRSSLLMAR